MNGGDLPGPCRDRKPLERLPDSVRLGTSWWIFPGWEGPREVLSDGEHVGRGLAACARDPLFRAVGIDSSYYRPLVTGHPIDVRRLPKDLREECTRLGFETRIYPRNLPAPLRQELEQRFFASIEPLARFDKLGTILVQYPPWFRATRNNAKTIELLRERHPECPFAVEFRHKSWLEATRAPRVWKLLEANRLSYVCVDEPPGESGGLPPTTRVTTEALALIRFHGQNQAGWAKRGASVQERFDYLYSEQELSAWVQPVKRLSEQARRVHAVFNNCVRNYAVLGAKGLVVLLGVSSDPC